MINRTLVTELVGQFIDGTYRPVLVDFPSLTLCSSSALKSLQEVSRDVLKMIEQKKHPLIVRVGGSIQSLPSLAGLLLSYPAIYHSEDLDARLLDTDVNVISLRTDGTKPRVLMQFSCPLNFLDEVTTKLTPIIEQWESRISQLSPSLQEKWRKFTGVESCTLKIHIETRRVPILSL